MIICKQEFSSYCNENYILIRLYLKSGLARRVWPWGAWKDLGTDLNFETRLARKYFLFKNVFNANKDV